MHAGRFFDCCLEFACKLLGTNLGWCACRVRASRLHTKARGYKSGMPLESRFVAMTIKVVAKPRSVQLANAHYVIVPFGIVCRLIHCNTLFRALNYSSDELKLARLQVFGVVAACKTRFAQHASTLSKYHNVKSIRKSCNCKRCGCHDNLPQQIVHTSPSRPSCSCLSDRAAFLALQDNQ